MKKPIDFRFSFSNLYILCCLHPFFLFSQNTATVSGNWNECNTWGNPVAIYRNKFDTKTINGGITVTANENWSTSAIQLNDGSAVNFSGSTVVDFTTDQGADKFCGPVTPSGCGAYIAPSVWKEFKCHNLGADTNADPLTPSAAIHGAKYQWGRSSPALTQAQDQANAGTISGWNNSLAPDGSWDNNSKTGNDPCPSGFKVPSKQNWDGVIQNNSFNIIGSWGDSSSNYSAGVRFGTSLFIPAAGGRTSENSGSLFNRGLYGYCWGAGEAFPTGYNGDTIAATYTNANTGNGATRNSALSVRCIAE